MNANRYEGAGYGKRLRLNDYAGGDCTEWPVDLRIRQFPTV